MNVFDLLAKISLDTTEYDKGLDAIKSAAGKIGGIATKAIGAATAAVGAFGIASVKTGMGFDTAMSQVAATMGKTVDQMMNEVGTVDLFGEKFTGNLRDYAQELGAKTVFSATQAAEALNYMALAGYDTEKSMSTLPNVLNLAAAGAMDLASASDMITDAETALGIANQKTEDGMSRTSRLVDEMARTASKTNTSVSQLGSAILTIGGTAKQLKGGMVEMADGTERAYDGTTELSAALGILADNGIKGGAAGTTLRNILSSLSSKKFETFKELGVQAYDAQGNMRSLKDILADMSEVMEGMTEEEKTKLINSVFNARDLKSVNALLATTGDRWDEITVALLDSKGAAEDMANTQLDNLAGDITLFQSALEGAQIAISDKVSPSLRDFVKLGSEGLSDFTKTLKGGDMIGAIASLGKTVGSLATEAIKRVPDMVRAGVALLEGFVGGIASAATQIDFKYAVVPLILGLSYKIRDAAKTLTTAGLDILQSIGNGIDENQSYLSSVISVLFENLYGVITDNVPVLLEAGLEAITRLGEGIGEGLPDFLENTVLPFALQASEFLREQAGNFVDVGIDFILNIAQGLMDSLPTLLEQLPQIVINIAGVINDNAPKLIVGGVKLILMIVQGIINAIPALIENFPKIFEMIISVWSALNWVNIGQNAITWIKNGVENLKTQIPNALKDIGNKAIEFFKNIQWGPTGTKVIEFITAGVKAVPHLIAVALVGLGTAAASAFKAIDWRSLGSHVVEGIVNGIKAGIDWVKDAARNLAQKAKEAAENLLGIKSPSRVFRYYGEMIDKGLSLGIDQNAEDAIESAEKLAKKTVLPFDDLQIPSMDVPEPSYAEAETSSSGETLAAILDFLRKNWPDNDNPEPIPIVLDGGGTVGYYDRKIGVRANMKRRGVI